MFVLKHRLMEETPGAGDGAAPEVVETPEVTPETPTEAESSTAAPKEPVQLSEEDQVRKRIDKIVWQREEARRQETAARQEVEHWKRKAQEREAPEAHDPTKPNVNDPRFKNWEEYNEALADWKIDTRLRKAQDDHRKRTETDRFNESKRVFDERAAKTREKYPDFDELFENAPISEAMAPAILDSESGPEIAVYLSKNPDVARKLYNLSPVQAAREIGKIEAKLDSLLPTKTVTEAKPPLKPVRPKGEASDGLSDDVPIEVWMKNRNKQLGRS